MKGLRFWQKTYVATFLVFVLALDGGLALAGWRSHDILFEGELAQALDGQRIVAQSIARDVAQAKESSIPLQVRALAQAYDNQLFNTMMRVEVDGEEVFASSGFGEGDPSLHAAAGAQGWMRATFSDGGDYLVVGGGLADDASGVQVTCAHSLARLDQGWRAITWKLLTTSALTSAAVAVGLYFALRSLSRPLERLARVADDYAAGDRSVRASVRGGDEVAALGRSFNNLADSVERTIDEIQQVADANERMAASLSHEVRTPLTAIRGYAEYLQIAALTPEEGAQAAAYLVHESTRLQRTAQRMMQLFAVESEPLERVPVDLAKVADAAAQTVRAQARERGVTVDVEAASAAEGVADMAPKGAAVADPDARVDAAVADPDAQAGTSGAPPLVVEGDPVLLESMAVNLLANAVSACSEGGRVTCALETDAGQVRLRVSDDGCGMSADELARLGEPFYRPDKARSRANGGAGLGVALSRRIAAAHGARLFYESEPGVGTTATVVFTCP